MKKIIICLILGVSIGWCVRDVTYDKEVRTAAEVEAAKTDIARQLSSKKFLDSMRFELDRKKIKADIEKQQSYIRLASEYKEYTSEGMAKRIIEITTKEYRKD